MNAAEKIRSNVAVHGVRFAVSVAKRQHIPFDMFYYVMFGRYPVR